MSKRTLLLLLPGALLLAGCPKAEITETDTANMRKEFSEENYEKNMRAMGKGAELEAEKKRAEAYSQGQ